MYSLNHLIKHANDCQAFIHGRWVPARPMRTSWLQILDAWLVLIGKADAVKWPEGQ